MATKGMSVFRNNGEDFTINDPNNAPEFDVATAYDAGQYVTYQGNLFRLTADHSAGTAWSGTSKTQVKISAELENLNGEMGNVLTSRYIPSSWSAGVISGGDGTKDTTPPFDTIAVTSNIFRITGSKIIYTGETKNQNGENYNCLIAFYTDSNPREESFIGRYILTKDYPEGISVPASANYVMFSLAFASTSSATMTNAEKEGFQAENVNEGTLESRTNLFINKTNKTMKEVVDESEYIVTSWGNGRLYPTTGDVDSSDPFDDIYRYTNTMALAGRSKVIYAGKDYDEDGIRYRVHACFYSTSNIATSFISRHEIMCGQKLAVPSGAMYVKFDIGRDAAADKNMTAKDTEHFRVLSNAENLLSRVATMEAETEKDWLKDSVQISDGMSQTSGDGVRFAYDKKYGVMFAAYMPGEQGHYGESRGKIALAVFPPTQPENLRTVIISNEQDDYGCQCLPLGNGVVRVFWVRRSRESNYHFSMYRDYDFINDALTEPANVQFSSGGETVNFRSKVINDYLKANGYPDSTYGDTEPYCLQGCSMFTDGTYWYASSADNSSPALLIRSADNGITWSPFAICPYTTEFEFDYRIISGVIYAIYRTGDSPSIKFTRSADGGNTWLTPIVLDGSEACRPNMIKYKNGLLLGYNLTNKGTEYRPAVVNGRTEVKFVYMADPQENPRTRTSFIKIHSNYGIVNIAMAEILGDVYMAYSTSIQAMEYQNGDSLVRGKDAVRFVKIGYLGNLI